MRASPAATTSASSHIAGAFGPGRRAGRARASGAGRARCDGMSRAARCDGLAPSTADASYASRGASVGTSARARGPCEGFASIGRGRSRGVCAHAAGRGGARAREPTFDEDDDEEEDDSLASLGAWESMNDRGRSSSRRQRDVTSGVARKSDDRSSWRHLSTVGGTLDLDSTESVDADDENDKNDGWRASESASAVPMAELNRAFKAVKPSTRWGAPARDGSRSKLVPLGGRRLTSKIKELGDARRLEDVFELLEMSSIPSTPNGRKITIGAVIGACVKCKELDVAYKMLMQLDGVNECGAGAPAYSTLMLGYAREGRLLEALELLDQWEKGRGPKDGKFGLGKRGNIIMRGSWKWTRDDVPKFGKKDDMGTEWHPKRTATTRMLFAALDACATNGDVQRTRKFMKRIQTWEGRVKGDTFNEDEYLWNALVKACARSNDALLCLNVLPEMARAGVEPTRVTYNITLSACAKAGRPDWCRALLKRMSRLKDENRRPNEVSYTTTLVAECAAARELAGKEHAGGVDVVIDLWREFRENEVSYDGIVIGAFVNAFVAYGDMKNALYALEFGIKQNLYISPSVYFTVMRSLATSGDIDGVRGVGNKLRKKNKSEEIAAECDMFQAEACAAAGDVEGARAAIFSVQNRSEEAAAKVFRARSSGVLVALFVQEVLECDVKLDESFDDGDDEQEEGLKNTFDEDPVASLCRWEKPDVWSVTQALDLLDGAWSYDEFDEEGIGASPAPPPRGGWASAVNAGAVEPLLFKDGVAPNEPIQRILPNIGDSMREGVVVRRSEIVAEALERLRNNNTAVVVDDDTGVPIGTFRRADSYVGAEVTIDQVMGAAPERLSNETTTVGEAAMICVRDAAALIAIVDNQGRLTGVVRQDDILVNPRRLPPNSPR